MIHPVRKPNYTHQKGQVIPLAAVFMIALIPIIAFAVNVSLSGNEQSHGQSGADATALSAAYVITKGGSEASATATADTVAQANGLPSGSFNIEYLDSTGAATTNSAAVAMVEVTATKTANAPLGSFLGILQDKVNVTSYAHVGGTGPVCGICVLSTSANDALSVTGNSSINVASGPIVVDSSSSTSLYTNGTASITASSISLSGTYSASSATTFSAPPMTGQPAIPNPLSGVPAPIVSGPIFNNTSPGSNIMSPGVYTAPFTITGGEDVTMDPGIYVFEGGFTDTGGGTLTATGVTMYMTCAGYTTTNTEPCVSGSSSDASISLGGSTTYDISAPSSGTYTGIVIMADPNNTAAMTLSGTSSDTINGTIYAPSEPISISGDSTSSTGYSIDSIIVANSIAVSGNGTVNLNAAQETNSPYVYDGGLPYLAGS